MPCATSVTRIWNAQIAPQATCIVILLLQSWTKLHAITLDTKCPIGVSKLCVSKRTAYFFLYHLAEMYNQCGVHTGDSGGVCDKWIRFDMRYIPSSGHINPNFVLVRSISLIGKHPFRIGCVYSMCVAWAHGCLAVESPAILYSTRE